MKTPDEIKKGLECCMDHQSCTDFREPKCPYNDMKECVDALLADALALIQQLEAKDTKQYQIIAELNARYSQVSKALCGNENATLEEVLQAVEQVKQNKPGKKLICQITIPTADTLRKMIEEVELDGKTLAEWLELLKGYKQLEAELAAVKRERDAAVRDCSEFPCNTCEYNNPHFYSPFCRDCIKAGSSRRTNHEWRGVCPDTEVQEDG